MKKSTVIIIVQAIIIVVLGTTVVLQQQRNPHASSRRSGGSDPFQMKKLSTSENVRYAAMTADEAARSFFGACGRGDWLEVEKFWPGSVPMENRFKEALNGLEIVSIGKPFNKAGYAAVFVPYEIRFKNGETKKFNLAIRRDNPAGRWMFDGGL